MDGDLSTPAAGRDVTQARLACVEAAARLCAGAPGLAPHMAALFALLVEEGPRCQVLARPAADVPAEAAPAADPGPNPDPGPGPDPDPAASAPAPDPDDPARGEGGPAADAEPTSWSAKLLRALADRGAHGEPVAVTNRALAEATACSPVTVSAYLNRLEEEGSIERAGCRRARRLRITAQGWRALGIAPPTGGPKAPARAPAPGPAPTPAPAPTREGAAAARPPVPARVPGEPPPRPARPAKPDGLDPVRAVAAEAMELLSEAGREAGPGSRPGLYRLDGADATVRELLAAANAILRDAGEAPLVLPPVDPPSARRGDSALAGA